MIEYFMHVVSTTLVKFLCIRKDVEESWSCDDQQAGNEQLKKYGFINCNIMSGKPCKDDSFNSQVSNMLRSAIPLWDWDGLFKKADGCACNESALRAKDTARGELEKIAMVSDDIATCENVEECIDQFLAESDSIYLFGNNGSLIAILKTDYDGSLVNVYQADYISAQCYELLKCGTLSLVVVIRNDLVSYSVIRDFNLKYKSVLRANIINFTEALGLLYTELGQIPRCRLEELCTLFKDGLIEDAEDEAYTFFRETCDLSPLEREWLGLDEGIWKQFDEDSFDDSAAWEDDSDFSCENIPESECTGHCMSCPGRTV